MAKRLEQLNKDDLLTVIQVIACGDPSRIEVGEIVHDSLGAQVEVEFDNAVLVFFGWPERYVHALCYIDSPTARKDLLEWLCELFFDGQFEETCIDRGIASGKFGDLSEEQLEELTIWDLLHEEVQQLLYELMHTEGDEAEWLTSDCEWKRKLADKFSTCVGN